MEIVEGIWKIVVILMAFTPKDYGAWSQNKGYIFHLPTLWPNLPSHQVKEFFLDSNSSCIINSQASTRLTAAPLLPSPLTSTSYSLLFVIDCCSCLFSKDTCWLHLFYHSFCAMFLVFPPIFSSPMTLPTPLIVMLLLLFSLYLPWPTY